VAVSGLFEWKTAKELWHVDKRDFSLMLVTFLATLVLGIEEGILVGIVLSLVLVIHQSTYPHTAVLGRLPDTTVYRNLARNPQAIVDKGVLIIRVDASFYFANTAQLKETIRKEINTRPDTRTVIIEMYPVNTLDSTALHGLKNIARELQELGIDLMLTGVKGYLFEKMERDGIVQTIGPDRFFHKVHDAVMAATNTA